MGKADFFDDDLIRERGSAKSIKFGPGNEPPSDEDVLSAETVPVHELQLMPLGKRKEQMNGKMATKLEELERLRARQDSLEREKSALEQMRSNQEKYEIEKREMIDHLEQCLVSLERDEIALNKKLEILHSTRTSFKEMDEELRSLNEAAWPTDSEGHREELTKGLALLESMRKDYHKALSRLDSVTDGKPIKSKEQPLLDDDWAIDGLNRRSFTEWLLIGLAFNLPLALIIGAIVIFLVLRYQLIFLP